MHRKGRRNFVRAGRALVPVGVDDDKNELERLTHTHDAYACEVEHLVMGLAEEHVVHTRKEGAHSEDYRRGAIASAQFDGQQTVLQETNQQYPHSPARCNGQPPSH